MKALSTTATLIVVLIAPVCTPIALTSNQTPQVRTRIDLSGRWDDGGRAVTITDSVGSVKAKYSKTRDCNHEGRVTKYAPDFVVQGTGNTLSGTGDICYYGDKKEPDKPGKPPNLTPRGVKKAKVTLIVSAHGNTLQGEQVGYYGTIKFTVTRCLVNLEYASANSCACEGKYVSCLQKAQNNYQTCMDTIILRASCPGIRDTANKKCEQDRDWCMR